MGGFLFSHVAFFQAGVSLAVLMFRDKRGFRRAVIQANGVGAEQPAHTFHKVWRGGLCDEVKMISHQAVGMDLPAGLLTRFCQRFEEFPPVNIVEENVFTAITRLIRW